MIPWNKGKKGVQPSTRKGTRTGQIPWNKGRECLPHVKEAISRAKKGQPAWNKGIPAKRGSESPNWKGGLKWNAKNHHDYQYALSIKPSNCESCGIAESDLKKSLCFDHNHTTGEFRGWICNHCNMILGFSKDNALVLEGVRRYLESKNMQNPQ